jgi:hypothetical protein
MPRSVALSQFEIRHRIVLLARFEQVVLLQTLVVKFDAIKRCAMWVTPTIGVVAFQFTHAARPAVSVLFCCAAYGFSELVAKLFLAVFLALGCIQFASRKA